MILDSVIDLLENSQSLTLVINSPELNRLQIRKFDNDKMFIENSKSHVTCIFEHSSYKRFDIRAIIQSLLNIDSIYGGIKIWIDTKLPDNDDSVNIISGDYNNIAVLKKDITTDDIVMILDNLIYYEMSMLLGIEYFDNVTLLYNKSLDIENYLKIVAVKIGNYTYLILIAYDVNIVSYHQIFVFHDEYEKIINDNWKNIGPKLSYIHKHEKTDYINYINSLPTLNILNTNKYAYVPKNFDDFIENINAIYVQAKL